MASADERPMSDLAEQLTARIMVQRAGVETTLTRIRTQIARLTSSTDDDLPPVGTTVSEALLAVAAELSGQSRTLPGTMAMGYRAGQDAVVRGLRNRAAATSRGGADEPRPAPAAVPEKRPARSYPWRPTAEERERYVNSWFAAEWESRRLTPGERAAFGQAARELFDVLHAQSNAADELVALTDRMDAADSRWRNTLASVLRAHANEFQSHSGSNADPFAIGYRLATGALARRLKERAEQIEVPGPS